MGVIRITQNVRITNDFNMSLTAEHMIDNEEQAREVGEQDQKIFDAYAEGYTKNLPDD